MKRYSDEVKERAREMYASGMSSREVAREIGCGERTVRSWVETRSLSEAGRRASGYTEGVRERAREMYASGMSSREVAREIGCGERTVRSWVETRSKRGSRYAEEVKERARALYASGMPSTEVARKIGCSAPTVRSWVETRSKSASRYTEGVKERAREMYASGMSSTEVAREIGCSTAAVCIWAETRSKSEAGRLASGLTDEQRTTRTHRSSTARSRSKAWRKAVLAEYRVGRWYRCACCRETFRRQQVQVDHIVPFVELMERHGLFDCDLETFDAATSDPAHPLFDVANGRVVCKACHKSAETYGARALSYERWTQTTLIDASGGTP